MRFVCEREVGFRREKARLLVVGRLFRRRVERRVGRIILAGWKVVLWLWDWDSRSLGFRGSTREGTGLRHRLPRAWGHVSSRLHLCTCQSITRQHSSKTTTSTYDLDRTITKTRFLQYRYKASSSTIQIQLQGSDQYGARKLRSAPRRCLFLKRVE